MFAPSDPTTVQPQVQPHAAPQPQATPQPQGEAFRVGTGFDATVAMAPPTPQPVGPPTLVPAWAAPPVPPERHWGRKALVGLVIVGLAVGGGIAAHGVLRSDATTVASGSRPIGSDLAGALPDQPAVGTPVTDAPTTTAAAPTTTAAPATTTPAPTNPPAPPAEPPAEPPAPANPTVVSVDAPATVLCTPGDTPYIVVSWSVAHADEVVLSIDGPGAYRTYPGADGSDAVPFACGEAQHSYTITAKADGYQASRTVVIDATEVGGSPDLLSP